MVPYTRKDPDMQSPCPAPARWRWPHCAQPTWGRSSSLGGVWSTWKQWPQKGERDLGSQTHEVTRSYVCTCPLSWTEEQLHFLEDLKAFILKVTASETRDTHRKWSPKVVLGKLPELQPVLGIQTQRGMKPS